MDDHLGEAITAIRMPRVAFWAEVAYHLKRQRHVAGRRVGPTEGNLGSYDWRKGRHFVDFRPFCGRQ